MQTPEQQYYNPKSGKPVYFDPKTGKQIEQPKDQTVDITLDNPVRVRQGETPPPHKLDVAETLMTPPESLVKWGREKAYEMTTPHLDEYGYPRMVSPLKSFGAGALQGIIGQATPANVAMAGLGGLETSAGKMGWEAAVPYFRMGTKAASLPVAYEGATRLLDPESDLGQRAQGLAELTMGGVGILHGPTSKPNVSNVKPEINPEVRLNELMSRVDSLTPAEMGEAQRLNIEVRKSKGLQERRESTRGVSARGVSDEEFINSIRELVGDSEGTMTLKQLNNKAKSLSFKEMPLSMRSRLGNMAKNEVTPPITPEKKDVNLTHKVVTMPGSKLSEFEQEMRGSLIGERRPDVVGAQLEDVAANNLLPKTEVQSKVELNQPTTTVSKGTGSAFEKTMQAKSNVNKPSVSGNEPPVPPNKPPSGGEPPSGGSNIPPNNPYIIRIKQNSPQSEGIVSQIWNATKGAMGVDLPFMTSAAFRQGFSQIGTKNWFNAWIPAAKSWGSEAAFKAHDALIHADPLVTRSVEPVIKADGMRVFRNGQPIFREKPSIIEQMGVRLTDVRHGMSGADETIRSGLAEKIPIWGRIIKRSNRAYQAYMNDLTLGMTRNFYEAMPDKNNIAALKDLGDAINTLTKRASLSHKIPLTNKVASIEKASDLLSNVLWTPRGIASNIKMLDPSYYATLQPQARKAVLSGLLRTAGAWMTFAGIGKLIGASVNLDPTNSDFGKIRIGNTRIDPPAGLQQVLVLYSRLGTGRSTSSTTGRTTQLGRGNFKPTTRGDILQNFMENRLHPSLSYFWDALNASEGKPFGVFDRAAQLATPMFMGDLIDIAKEDPALLPALGPLIGTGMSGQVYQGKGDINKPKLVPRNLDFTIGGR